MAIHSAVPAFDGPGEFRELLRKLNAVIACSEALSWLDDKWQTLEQLR